jgi:Na+/proline symporter
MLVIGLYMKRRASKSIESYFIGERKLSWWLIGVADVAFFGVSPVGFVWILFVGGFMEFWLAGWAAWCIWMPLVTVVWAKMWRRLGIVTSGEFIEVRYGGRFAGVYRALYGGYAFFVWSITSMAYVGAIFIQTISPILGWQPLTVLLVFGSVVVFYTMLAGLFGVVYTDLVQLGLVFIGSFVFMFILVSKLGGFEELYRQLPLARGADFFRPVPPGGKVGWVTLIVLIVQGFFFAGHPFAGEGATAQRFMAARNERHAVLGQMFNLILSLVVRLIPALFIGFAVIILYPANIVEAPPALWARAVRDYAPSGVLGFLFAGALAAYMAATAATLNWGSSYFINDVYKRHLRPEAKNSEHILVSRLVAVAALTVAYSISLSIDPRDMEPWLLFINSTVVAFSLPLSWLKWFWWRMNVFGDAIGILGGVPAAAVVWFGSDAIIPSSFRGWVFRTVGLDIRGMIPRFGDTSIYPFWLGFLILFLLGWAVILTVTLLTPPEDPRVLSNFYRKVRPIGWWGPVAREFPLSLRQDILEETKKNLLACAAGIIFSFSLMISFFSFYAAWYKLAVAALPVFLLSGYFFYRLALKAYLYEATESQLAEKTASLPS